MALIVTRYDAFRCEKSLVQRQYEHREAYYYYGLYRECAASKVAKCIGVTVAKAPLFQCSAGRVRNNIKVLRLHAFILTKYVSLGSSKIQE